MVRVARLSVIVTIKLPTSRCFLRRLTPEKRRAEPISNGTMKGVATSSSSPPSSAPPSACRYRMQSSAPRSIASLLAHRSAACDSDTNGDAAFADEMAARAIAEYTDEANAQHYEVPAAFFAKGAGTPHRGILLLLLQGGSIHPAGGRGRGAAPDCRPRRPRRWTIDPRAGLRLGVAVVVDGATLPPSAGHGGVQFELQRRISKARRAARSHQSARHHFRHERVRISARFDRIVSVEMFEHMLNWHALMIRVRSWLRRTGVSSCTCSHPRSAPTRRRAGSDDWIASSLLHRRGDAEPSSDAALCRSPRGG